MVTVYPNPTVSAGVDQTLCEGVSVVLSGSGALTYSWDNNVVNNIQFQPPSGSTVYTVAGTDANGCTGSDQVTITVIEAPVPSFQINGAGCVPVSLTLTNTTPDAQNCNWSISNGAVLTGCGSVTTVLTQPGCFDVTLSTTVNGCSASFTATNIICAEAAPIADFSFSPGTVSTLDPIVQFQNLSSGATNYIWNFGDNSALSNETNPSHVYPDDATSNYEVMLVAYSQNGCTDTAYAYITVEEEVIFYVPNTFTPDGDVYNQTFQPVFTSGFDPYDYHLTIFNRWGQIVFESYNHLVGWDGTYGGVNGGDLYNCQDGTYTWKIEFKRLNNDGKKMVIGHVNLLR
jgi:gliding motility-associated-like protein